MAITLAGKTALVTGAGSGIGRAIALAFANLDARIVVADIDPVKNAKLRDELAGCGARALVVQTDVRKGPEVAHLMREIEQSFGGLDVLVNNVGSHLGIIKKLEATSDEEINALYETNLRHMFVVTRAALPLLRRSGKGASIINVSSIEGFRGCPTHIAYTTFKHAITGFTRSLAMELAHENIRVNTLAPETTESEQVPVEMLMRPKYREHTLRTIPLGRFGKPEDSAGAAIYLATDLSAWVTGTSVHVDGGGYAAGGFYRTPDGTWTVQPVVTAAGLGYPPHEE
jgi:NAD(P)-dependent dehydrogenase (short-subunit alcohol dehydrogenase family)